jgi:hypothetical protein
MFAFWMRKQVVLILWLGIPVAGMIWKLLVSDLQCVPGDAIWLVLRCDRIGGRGSVVDIRPTRSRLDPSRGSRAPGSTLTAAAFMGGSGGSRGATAASRRSYKVATSWHSSTCRDGHMPPSIRPVPPKWGPKVERETGLEPATFSLGIGPGRRISCPFVPVCDRSCPSSAPRRVSVSSRGDRGSDG